jgi:hypothetical protein
MCWTIFGLGVSSKTKHRMPYEPAPMSETSFQTRFVEALSEALDAGDVQLVSVDHGNPCV